MWNPWGQPAWPTWYPGWPAAAAWPVPAQQPLAGGQGEEAQGAQGTDGSDGRARAEASPEVELATYRPAEVQPFRVQPLKGISEATQRNHLELYRAYVANTNEARQELLRRPAWEQADPNHSKHRLHRLGEMWSWNGAKNHEMFFSILSPTPRPPSGPILDLIRRDFGSFERFRREFAAAARSVRGWAMLAYDLDDGRLHIFAGDGHDQAVWNAVVLLGIDVFEHAYFIDYGTRRDAYIEAFFANLDWEAVNARLRKYGLVR